MSDNNFEWVDFYKETARKILGYKDDRSDLVNIVKDISDETGINISKLDKGNGLHDIDPFTFFGLFNMTSMKVDIRIKIVSIIAESLDISAEVPETFDSIPVLNPLNTLFYSNEQDITDLWEFFDAALSYAYDKNYTSRQRVAKDFDICINKSGNGNSKISMGLYWIAPDVFINIDNTNVSYIYKSGVIPDDVVASLPHVHKKISSSDYFEILDRMHECIENGKCKFKNFEELSFAAWQYHKDNKPLLEDEDSGWIPSLEEYDPGLTSEELKKCLEDPDVIKPHWHKYFYYLYNMGGAATCTEIAEKYGGTAQQYKNYAGRAAINVLEKTKCSEPPLRDNGNKRYWPVLFVGKSPKEYPGRFIWKMRPALKEAVEELIDEGFFDDVEEENMKNVNDNIKLNTILYGPPGTGKTYSSVIYAVAIIEGKSIEDIRKENYPDVLVRYNQYKTEGRIAFTTFHQSYGYEEFIEGIRPETDEETRQIRYYVRSGVFKEFCESAGAPEIRAKDIDIPDDAMVWEAKVRSNVTQDCFDNDRVRIDWGFDSDIGRAFMNDVKKGDIIITSVTSRKRINGIAVVTEDDAFELDGADEDKSTRRVKWLAKNIDEDIVDINVGKQLHRMTLARVPFMKVQDIVALAKKDNPELGDIIPNTKPYVFIIDEINRGNISKIFGELITLIEENKRKGASEAADALLPYSGERFSVPDNVYILGTMNTADRSIAIIDTALRRRFDFVEMMPDSEVLRKNHADTVMSGGKTLDVAGMLDVINARIEFLFDREHTIGHAFFLGLTGDNATIENLAEIFRKNVIPLLQEFFYDDYGKIQLVLGDNGNCDEEYKLIIDHDARVSDLFSNNGRLRDSEITFSDSIKYEINEEAFYHIESYIKIYDGVKEYEISGSEGI